MPKFVLALLAALLTTAGVSQVANQVHLPYIIAPPATVASTTTPTTTSTPTDTATPTATSTSQPGPTSTHTPTVTPTATTQPSGPCPCHADVRNCSDFSTHSAAQACFDYCVSQGAGDIHRLDQDNDGVACESLPGNFRMVR